MATFVHKLLAYVAEHPGLNTATIEEAVGAQRGSVHVHVHNRFLTGTPATSAPGGFPMYDDVRLTAKGDEALAGRGLVEPLRRGGRGRR